MIDVNNGEHRVAAADGQSLFDALKDSGIFLPTICGGMGQCGWCKVVVKRGGGPVTPAEKKLLTPDKLAAGFRLACQVKVSGDMAVEIHEK